MIQDLKAIRFLAGTKISHDYRDDKVTLFSYRDLVARNIECIGIPARQNRLIIVDVDVPGGTHKIDGREWWLNFAKENNLQPTYTVRSPSGGYHFYYSLPQWVNEVTFAPPGELAPGVDLKFNGWVGAPPSPGYDIEFGTIQDIQEAPDALMNYIADRINAKPVKEFEGGGNLSIDLHRPFTDKQIDDLRGKLEWMKENATLSYSEWRDGLFSMKAGITDSNILEEFIDLWTMNKSYQPGDEHKARQIVERASVQGGVGPGTLLNIIRSAQVRANVVSTNTPFTVQEIFDRSGVEMAFCKDGSVSVIPSESNAACLIGAIHDVKDLYHDFRKDLYVFKGRPHSDVDIVNMITPMIQSPSWGLGLQKMKRSTISGGLDVLMTQRRVDPHKKYLESLEWDGVPRIEEFFIKYCYVQDREYIRLVGKKFWTALAARGLEPGCKFDSMLVLEGHEGISKSSIVEAIAGDYAYAPDRKDSFDHIDVLREMHQSVIVELPELVGILHQPAEKIKSFLSKPNDMIRDLFARKAVRNLRGFVFVGTTNSDRWLTAAAGVRRFWPIRIPETVKNINLSGIRSDRDQLFAEAVQSYRSGNSWWDIPKEMLDQEVKTRVSAEPLLGPIRDMRHRFGAGWTVHEVFEALQERGFIVRGGLTTSIISRIEAALLTIGCVSIQDPVRGELWMSGMPMQTMDMKPTMSIDSFI